MRTRYLFGEKTVFSDETDILLSYYILDKELDIETGYEQWGIEVETHMGKKHSSERINYLCEDYHKAVKTIKILFENEVTATCFYEVINELYDMV